jgi:hypothetical protein
VLNGQKIVRLVAVNKVIFWKYISLSVFFLYRMFLMLSKLHVLIKLLSPHQELWQEGLCKGKPHSWLRTVHIPHCTTHWIRVSGRGLQSLLGQWEESWEEKRVVSYSRGRHHTEPLAPVGGPSPGSFWCLKQRKKRGRVKKKVKWI